MSTQAPTLSPTTAAQAKAIPGARPRPIAGASGAAGSPSGRGAGGLSPSSASASMSTSFRRGGHSLNDTNGTPDDSNWRTRGSVDKGSSEAKGRGPERTVGGFEKSEVRGGGGASALSSSKGKASALSHVPCRFFKAGACTAGSSCPFSHEVGGKKEVCQWFLKGDCKFGHKCALAHVRPGEPMSMDRRNKKEQQREARERAEADKDGVPREAGAKNGRSLEKSDGDEPKGSFGTSPVASFGVKVVPAPVAPVPIKSAISASLGSSLHSPSRLASASSPLREPYGPPPTSGSPSAAGFNHTRPVSGSAGFASSPSRPSPLSASYTNRPPVPSSLKASSIVSAHSPLRPPTTTAVFSSSFSHTSSSGTKSGGQLSASFADGTLQRSIWARSETPDEPLSPPVGRRPVLPPGGSARFLTDVFDEHDDHGEDLLPSSLSDLLTPTERARRMSRNDSHDSYAGSPSRQAFANPHQFVGAERLAQSASAALPPGGFLQSLWNQEGRDARAQDALAVPGNGGAPRAAGGQTAQGASPQRASFAAAAAGAVPELKFGGAQPQPPPLRQSLLSSSRHPTAAPAQSSSPNKPSAWGSGVGPALDAPYLMRGTDPSSPSARVLSEHAPGQSLPGGLAAALSRMHMHPGASGVGGVAQVRTPSGLGANTPDTAASGTPGVGKREDHDDEMFHMDG